MNFQFLAIFSVRLATKEEVLDRTRKISCYLEIIQKNLNN